ncbi:EF hand [Humidesulfovibrio mexicanus]|uniref:EF hand n=2 Tax=Humidesulfovibrio mexicanus TaxID=147047 RepID=A0A238ZD30_9BACT|nr:EF hand [Humidesulfovibrio mexicanus]
MQINSSTSGTSSIFSMDEMDTRLATDMVSAKDSDSSGSLSASELGVSDSDVAEFDTDGDGVLSSAELAAALKAKREKMQAQMDSQMQQSSQLGMLQSTLSGAQGEEEAPSIDQLISGLFGDSGSDGSEGTMAVSAADSSETASNAGSSLSEFLEQMDTEMAATILNMKDTDGDGVLSAEELGATSEQIAELDTDGDGVLSQAELATGLAAERETMMAENGGVMPPPPPAGEQGVSGAASSMDSTAMDAMMQSMFSTGTGVSGSGDSSTTTATLQEFLLRQKASSAYQSVDNLIAGLFSGGADSRSVSLDA